MTATIKLKSKPVAGDAQHMYLVYTNEAGEERVLRGGPEGSDLKGALIGDVEVVNTIYDEKSIDWDKDNNHFSQTIFTGTDAEIQAKVDLMNTEMDRINTEGYDYNLPIVETIIPAWADLNEQNSNTVVVSLARAAGLESEVKTVVFDNGLNTPGYLANFEHSAFEKNTESLYEAIKDVNGSVSGFFSDAKESINDFKSDSKDFFFDLFGIETEDQQSRIPQSDILTPFLNLQVNTSPDSNNATADPNDALTGTVLPGGDYFGSMSSDVANVDDYSSAQMTRIASNDLRVANDELADNSVDNILSRTATQLHEQQKIQQQTPIEEPGFWDKAKEVGKSFLSTITSVFTEAPKVQNVDPLILDLNNNGVELIHFDNSIVSFDVDNDGYKENTGWVDGNDGILVHDKNADGVINDITETISEYYNANDNSVLIDDQNRYFADGLEALKALDSNDDNVFNNQDDLWNTLRVWQDENEDGLTDEGEIKTLEEHNIESIDLNRQISYRERLEGNPVLSRSNMTMTDGTTREVAAVDFATNPIGYEWNDVYEQGSKITTEDGQSSSFVVTGQAGQTVDLANEGVNSAYGSIGDDTLIGDANDNWLMGGLGSDTLIGGAGDDVIMIDAEDLNENIDGGEGMDVIKVIGDDSVTFNLAQSNAEILNSGGGDDVLLGGGVTNAFISGGGGDDIIIGGASDDALSGEDGNDMLDGGYGDDILRGHRGEDLIIGGKGDDLLEGGLGNDDLRGGEGNDVLMGNEGDDVIDGGEGFDMVEYQGNYDQYSYLTQEDGTIKVTNSNDGSVDTITNVERLRFGNVDINLGDANSLPLPVKDSILVDDSGQFILDQSQILANDFSTSGKSFSVREVSDAVGGTVELREDGNIIFTPDPYFTGTMSFDYSVVDEDGLYATINKENSDGVVETVNLKAQVNLVNESDPSDPLYYDQWYLSEIRIKTAWEDYSGQGIDIGIFEGDYGNPLNHEHADLDDNISDYYLSNVLYEEDIDGFSNHATLVAGVIAAEKNNEGSIGIAYNSEISSFSWSPDVDGLDNLINYDIANNSWGTPTPFADDFVKDHGNSVFYEERERGIESAAEYGRDGLGTNIIFAGGNARKDGDNVNYHNTQNSRFVSTIGSINQEGDLSKLIEASDPFSNPGSAILVSAPGSNIKSTANLLENENGSTFGDDFETTQGTSFSAPITSGVVALMLEANPYLGYRDVQEILAKTARVVDDENTVWLKNADTTVNDGSGMHYSEDYGFGIIDAHSAIRVAEMWHDINNSINEEVVSNLTLDSQDISDNSEITSTLNINSDISIEHVEVYVNIDHPRITDLVLTLVSPDGAESLLVNKPGESLNGGESILSPDQDGLKFRLSTTNNYGENGTGDWVLKVQDTATGETGTLVGWELKLYGKKDNGDDDYIFTDEFGSSNGRTISDDSGNDSINAVSILTDSTINLNAGSDSNIAGKTVHIDSNSVIEEAYSGDGDDTLIGNEADNILYAGRGDNTLTGNAGADKFIIFKHENQTDTITDFNISEAGEKIDLTRFKFDGFSDLTINQQGNDAVVNLGNGQSLILQNVNATSLSQDNFTGFLDEQITLNGSSGVDNLYGDERDNIINAGDSDDYISGGTGDNIISGGQGSDIFFVSQNAGKTDTITDFDVNDINERISLRNFKEIKNIDDLNIIQEGNNAVILLDSGQKIVLDNIQKGELDNKNFIFFGQTLGTDQNNRMVGSDFPDLIDGGDGNDVIRGLEWDDNIYGGKGNDVLRGDHGDDKLYGGDGNDTLVGGVGGDIIYGGQGDDLISGGNTDTDEYGDDKTNTIYGQGGNDDIYGDKGNDYLSGGDGSDYLSGRMGDDELHGGNDDDRLYGGEGDDLIYGGEGSDIINGDSYIDLDTNTIIDTDLAENGDDTIYGDNGNDYIFAKGGNDTIYGGNDDDYIDGGEGDDEIYGEAGNDTIVLSSGNDTVDGGSGDNIFVLERNVGSTTTINNFNTESDKIDLNSYDESVELGNFNIAQDGNDTLVTFRDSQTIRLTNIDSSTLSFDNFISDLFSFLSDNVNSINGTANADYIVGGNNLDTINGLDGNDTIYGNDGDDFLHGGNGDDKLYGGDGDDSLYGNGTRDLATLEVVNHDTNTGNNQLYGGAGDDVLLGGSGNDYLDGGTGDDQVFGGDGNDIIIGGDGNNHLQGGSGNDIIDLGTGVESVLGDSQVNFAFGEQGSDTFAVSDKFIGFSYKYDVIADFDVDDPNEKIDVSKVDSIMKYSDLTISQNGSDTYILFNTNSFGYSQVIKLENVDSSELNESKFIIVNEAPEVNNDIAILEEDNSVIIDIFANDSDDKSDIYKLPKSNIIVNDANNGSVILNDDYTITYTPDPNFHGTDSFSYSVIDEGGITSSEAEVMININSVNDSPIVTKIIDNQDFYSTREINFEIGNVFDEVDGEELTYDAALLDGSPIPFWINFDPVNLNFSGTAPISGGDFSIKVTATDESGNKNSTNFTLTIDDSIIIGTENDDNLAGTSTDDIIDGNDGNDIINDGYGNDIVFGGFGDDQLTSGGGYDKLYGEEGNDILKGNSGDQILNGGEGNDELYSLGSGSDDALTGGSGSDTFVIGNHIISDDIITDFDINDPNEKIDLSAFRDVATDISQLIMEQVGNDTKISFDRKSKTILVKNVSIDQLTIEKFIGLTDNQNAIGNLVINGTRNDDNLVGGSGDDIIKGDEGDDIIKGGLGSNLLTGDSGDDTFVISKNSGKTDIITDFEAFDKLQFDGFASNTKLSDFPYTEEGNSATFDLGDGQKLTFQNAKAADVLHYLSYENTILVNDSYDATAENEKIVLSTSLDGKIINGGDGDDIISGNDGNDVINGGTGNDVLRGGKWFDIFEIDKNPGDKDTILDFSGA